ncbi:MAG TPA: hypothetical protein VMD59_16675, partial [Acidimicrobiales bacterium]|nr:hypothetical protein [Acidimicrobiales bacterium]
MTARRNTASSPDAPSTATAMHRMDVEHDIDATRQPVAESTFQLAGAATKLTALPSSPKRAIPGSAPSRAAAKQWP